MNIGSWESCVKNMMKVFSTLIPFHTSYHLPSSDRTNIEEGRSRENDRHKDLFNAAIEGDWKTAEQILKSHPECATHEITIRKETVLHIAAAGKHREFVQKLVEMLKDKSELAKTNTSGCSAFYLAVLSGVVENARVMYKKNKELPVIRSDDGRLPINHAALRGRKTMVTYLNKITPFTELQEADRIELLEATIRYDMYDVALDILTEDDTLATKELERKTAEWSKGEILDKLERNQTILHLLARKPLAKKHEDIWRKFLGSACAVFSRRLWDTIQEKSLARMLLDTIWRKYLTLPEDKLAEIIKNTEILHYAAKEGNVEFLTMILTSKPDLLWEFNSKGQNIFHVAVLNRQKEVFDLLHRFGPFKDLISVQQDNDKNNILHSAAKLGTNSRSSKESISILEKVEKDMPKSLLKVSGAALRLQRELLWFTEVGYIVPPSQHKIRNKENKMPKQIFSEEHRELLKEGEKWMTNTASSCMIVATLIATMVFAAAFTVPGGNNGDTGTPIFLKRSSFIVFMISDAVAMTNSIVSIIMFLSILISRYKLNDFRVSLPLKLLVGLTTLFVSIVGMLVAFAVAFSLVINKAWQPKLIVVSIVAPFALFLALNFHLWFDTIKSILLVLKIKVSSSKKLYFG